MPGLVLLEFQVNIIKQTWTLQDMTPLMYQSAVRSGTAKYYPDLVVKVRRCQHDHSWLFLLASSCMHE